MIGNGEKERFASLQADYLGQGFSCAETAARTWLAWAGLPQDQAVLRMTSTYRGGCNIGGTCGLIESTLVFIDYARSTGAADWSEADATAMASSLRGAFDEAYGSTQCRVLWDFAQDRSAKTGQDVHCIIPDGLSAAFDALSPWLDRLEQVKERRKELCK